MLSPSKLHLPLTFVLAGLFGLLASELVRAQQDANPSDPTYEVKTEKPGIIFGVAQIRRIPQNRLLVIIYIRATSEVPSTGVNLNTSVMPPPGTKPWDLYKFRDKPFSLHGSTMTDELTGVQYPLLRPTLPPTMAYFPGGTRATFIPNHREILSIQFATPPPPPPPPPGQPPVIQKLSFSLPTAVGPITHVPLPPLGAPAPQ